MGLARNAYQRRARTALLAAGAVFVLVQLLAGVLLDRHGLAVRFPSAARALAAVPRNQPGPDVVLLGSSRFGALDAAEASTLLRLEHPEAGPVEVSNLAVPGGDPIAEEYVFERLLRQGGRPRLAVIEVSPDTLNEFNQMFALHPHRQITWLDTPTYFVDICRVGEFKKLAQARLVPLYAHRRELRRQALLAITRPSASPPVAVLGDPLPSLRADGRLPWESLLQVGRPPPSPAEMESWRLATRPAAKRFRFYQVGGTTAAALERLLQRCRSIGTDVVLIGAPNHSSYVCLFTPEIDAAYTAYMTRLTRTYGVRFLDCRAAVPDQLFADAAHLDPEGGRYFTRVLTRDVLSPWLRQHQAVVAGR